MTKLEEEYRNLPREKHQEYRYKYGDNGYSKWLEEQIDAKDKEIEELKGTLKKIKGMCDGNIITENNIWHECNYALKP